MSDNQIVIAERRSPFTNGETVFRKTGFPGSLFRFFHNVCHVVRSKELSFFDIDGLAGTGTGLDEVCLAAQESRCLQDVDCPGDRHDFRFGMNIGQYRYIELFFDIGQDVEPFFHTRSAKRRGGRTVCLVVGRFVNERDSQFGCHFFQGAGRIDRQLAGFDHAWTGNKKERFVESDFKTAKFHALFPFVSRACLLAIAALMKAVKSGWPSRGVDLNSGWY